MCLVCSGILVEGIGSLLDGIMGTGNGTTSTSINVGVVGLTKVCQLLVYVFHDIMTHCHCGMSLVCCHCDVSLVCLWCVMSVNAWTVTGWKSQGRSVLSIVYDGLCYLHKV